MDGSSLLLFPPSSALPLCGLSLLFVILGECECVPSLRGVSELSGVVACCLDCIEVPCIDCLISLVVAYHCVFVFLSDPSSRFDVVH